MTEEQRLRRAFEGTLAEALAGRGVVSCLGLDMETDEALWAVYDAAIGYRATGSLEELVAAARRAFEGQLDGTNAARWHERHERRFTAG